jgi:hypothetical protein
LAKSNSNSAASIVNLAVPGGGAAPPADVAPPPEPEKDEEAQLKMAPMEKVGFNYMLQLPLCGFRNKSSGKPLSALIASTFSFSDSKLLHSLRVKESDPRSMRPSINGNICRERERFCRRGEKAAIRCEIFESRFNER